MWDVVQGLHPPIGISSASRSSPSLMFHLYNVVVDDDADVDSLGRKGHCRNCQSDRVNRGGIIGDHWRLSVSTEVIPDEGGRRREWLPLSKEAQRRLM